MRVVFTFQARVQLREIHAYIVRDRPLAADEVIARIEHVAGALGVNPHIGRKISGSRLRRFPVRPYPYLIYYEVVGETVRVIRIRHAARFRQAFQEAQQVFVR